jgi:stringent starvation protein B
MQSLLPPKKDVALALLERASVFVHLDPRFDDVVVPPWLKAQSQLILQIGLNLAVSIPDLEVTERGISCTLSFSRRPHYCHIPWSAVYALVGEDGRGMVWPSDIPADVAAQAQPVQSRVGRSPRVDAVAVGVDATGRARRPKGPNLVALEGSKGGSVSVPAPPPKSERAHLRLVK